MGLINHTPERLLPSKTAREVLESKSSGVITVDPNTSVYDCMERMSAQNIGFLPVLDRGRLVGVFSERDYARKVILHGKASKDTKVNEIMTDKVVTASPNHTVSDCMAMMEEKGFRHLPVVEAGKLIGVLSIRDLMREVIAHHVQLIRELEQEKLMMTTSSGSY
jgi:CBS domain-containing protein